MQLAQPELDFLMSKSNQDKTADGLEVMGGRLAQEVVHYLQVQRLVPVVSLDTGSLMLTQNRAPVSNTSWGPYFRGTSHT